MPESSAAHCSGRRADGGIKLSAERGAADAIALLFVDTQRHAGNLRVHRVLLDERDWLCMVATMVTHQVSAQAKNKRTVCRSPKGTSRASLCVPLRESARQCSLPGRQARCRRLMSTYDEAPRW